MTEIEKIRSKIITISQFNEKIRPTMKGKLVFTNGCFDILHRGHIEYLAGASTLGNFLMIGLNSDDSVRRLKGEGRPVQDQDSRALLLAALGFVSAVIIFEDDTPLSLIEAVNPDVLVKGGDYKPEDIVGYQFVTSGGGKVYCLDFVPSFSSSSLISRLK